MTVPDGNEFAVCLTHDVDRPYKTVYQAVYYAITERRPSHLLSIWGEDDPYWQFDQVMAIEEELGVRSAFYFLNAPGGLADRPPRHWLRPAHWVQYLGRYDVTSADLADVVSQLDEGGWEVGLHGSLRSYDDPERLAHEKAVLEEVLAHRVQGGRQHYLRLSVPETWEHQAAAGLDYDASLGSSDEYGFRHGYDLVRPFDDEFVVFPLTLMEQTLPDPDDRFDAAWAACERLLSEAAANDAVMTVLWHPRYFNPEEFPGYQRLYRRLVTEALERGAWVGPPGELYDRIDHDSASGPDGSSVASGDPIEAPVDGDDPVLSDG